MPLPDVAATLKIPLGTAKSRLHYALAAMRTTVTALPIPSRRGGRQLHGPPRDASSRTSPPFSTTCTSPGCPTSETTSSTRAAAIRQRLPGRSPKGASHGPHDTCACRSQPVPLRALIVLALIVVLAAAALLVAVGSSIACPAVRPAPMASSHRRPAATSSCATALTGASRLLIGGAEEDSGPGSSPDGTLVAFYGCFRMAAI